MRMWRMCSSDTSGPYETWPACARGAPTPTPHRRGHHLGALALLGLAVPLCTVMLLSFAVSRPASPTTLLWVSPAGVLGCLCAVAGARQSRKGSGYSKFFFDPGTLCHVFPVWAGLEETPSWFASSELAYWHSFIVNFLGLSKRIAQYFLSIIL